MPETQRLEERQTKPQEQGEAQEFTMASVDMRALAEDMLAWEKLTLGICGAVLALGKTQVVGNVRATYSGGRKTYDYEGAGRLAPEETVRAFTKTTVTVDWRKVCEAEEITKIEFTESKPSVTLKLGDLSLKLGA